jgi:hypothetical protein
MDTPDEELEPYEFEREISYIVYCDACENTREVCATLLGGGAVFCECGAPMAHQEETIDGDEFYEKVLGCQHRDLKLSPDEIFVFCRDCGRRWEEEGLDDRNKTLEQLRPCVCPIDI